MNTSYWYPKKRCARNNVIVQRRISQIRTVLRPSHFVDMFWSTLGSPFVTDGIHYQSVVYENALCDVYAKALILKMHATEHNNLKEKKDHYIHAKCISSSLWINDQHHLDIYTKNVPLNVRNAAKLLPLQY